MAAKVGFALADSGESEPGDMRRVISPRATCVCGSRLHVLASNLSHAIYVHGFTLIGIVLYRVLWEFQKQISLEGASSKWIGLEGATLE